MSKKWSNETRVATRESEQAKRALGESLREIRRITARTRVAKWIGRHPVAMVCAVAGVSIAVTAYVCTRPGETPQGETRRTRLRDRASALLRRLGRFLLVDWLGQHVLKPATSGFTDTVSMSPATGSGE